MKRLLVFLLFFVMIGLNVSFETDTSSNSGATTNTQTNTSGSNITISGGYSQESTTLIKVGHHQQHQLQILQTHTGDQRVVNSASAIINVSNVARPCVVGVSVGVSKFGIGVSGGSYRTDENCERIKLSKVLNDLGMKVEPAVSSILCSRRKSITCNDTIRHISTYNGKIGDAGPKKEWKKYDKLRPDYETIHSRLKYIEKKNKKLEKEYEKKMLENVEELSKQQVELDAVAAEKQKLIDEMNELKGVKTV